PFVVTGTLVGIPRTRVSGPVVNQIQLRIVGDPAPGASAADLPCFTGPGFDAEVRPPVFCIERLETRPDPDSGIRPRVIGTPQDLSAAKIKCSHPTADAELATAVTDNHFVLDDEGRH